MAVENVIETVDHGRHVMVGVKQTWLSKLGIGYPPGNGGSRYYPSRLSIGRK